MSAAASPTLTIVPKRQTLVEYLDDVEAILDTMDGIDEHDGETRDVLSRLLIEKIAGTKSKVDSTCRVLANFEAAEAAAKIECARLEARAKYFVRQHERLETHLLAVLEASKLDRLEGNTSGIRRQKNPAKVVIDSEADLPLEFWRSPPVPPIPADVPDKKLIAAALKSDPQSCPGCRLEVSYRLVRS